MAGALPWKKNDKKKLPDSITHILTLAEQFSNNDLFALSIFLLTKNYLYNCLPSSGGFPWFWIKGILWARYGNENIKYQCLGVLKWF